MAVLTASPIQPIRVALLGRGMSARVFHRPLIEASDGFELAGIVNRNRTADATPLPYTSYGSVQEALDEPAVELVVVNTPHALHFEQAMAALQAGKHCLVEKPLSFTAKEAMQLFDLAGKKGLVLSVFQNRRYDSDFLALKGLLDSGKLGPVHEADIHFDRCRPVVDTANWKEQADEQGGVFWNLMPHLADQALSLFGQPESVAYTQKVLREGGRAADWAEAVLRYKRLTVRLKISYLAYGNPPKYRIWGQKGFFEKFGQDVQEAALAGGAKPGVPAWGQEPEALYGTLYDIDGEQSIPSPDGNYLRFYEALYRAIRFREEGPVTPEQAQRLAHLLETMHSQA